VTADTVMISGVVSDGSTDLRHGDEPHKTQLSCHPALAAVLAPAHNVNFGLARCPYIEQHL
jgi:hypothetical protein